MADTIVLDGLCIAIRRKAVRTMRLVVHPPDGRVSLTVPRGLRHEAALAFVTTRQAWIIHHQARLRAQAQLVRRHYVDGATHHLWGQAYVLQVVEKLARPSISLEGMVMLLQVRPASDVAARAQVVHAWHRDMLRAALPPLVLPWEARLGVKASAWSVWRMKTLWGSCSPRTGRIRLNAELVTRPPGLLEYVIAHELAHLIEPSHNKRFAAILDTHCPDWRTRRAALNAVPLAARFG